MLFTWFTADSAAASGAAFLPAEAVSVSCTLYHTPQRWMKIWTLAALCSCTTHHIPHYVLSVGWIQVNYILNSTSAQLGYTVPLMLVHAGKYRTEDKLKIKRINKLNTTKKANNTKHSTPKLAWFSRLLWHSARKWGGLILQSSRAHYVGCTPKTFYLPLAKCYKY